MITRKLCFVKVCLSAMNCGVSHGWLSCVVGAAFLSEHLNFDAASTTRQVNVASACVLLGSPAGVPWTANTLACLRGVLSVVVPHEVCHAGQFFNAVQKQLYVGRLTTQQGCLL